MPVSSFVCDICHKSAGSLYSKLIAEIREKNNDVKDNDGDNSSSITVVSSFASIGKKYRMAHIECCTTDQIKQMLLSQAEDQMMFYKDIINAINEKTEINSNNNNNNYESNQETNTSILNKIENFEQKYGSFIETRQGTSIDHNLLAYALMAELKRKNQ